MVIFFSDNFRNTSPGNTTTSASEDLVQIPNRGFSIFPGSDFESATESWFEFGMENFASSCSFLHGAESFGAREKSKYLYRCQQRK